MYYEYRAWAGARARARTGVRVGVGVRVRVRVGVKVRVRGRVSGRAHPAGLAVVEEPLLRHDGRR